MTKIKHLVFSLLLLLAPHSAAFAAPAAPHSRIKAVKILSCGEIETVATEAFQDEPKTAHGHVGVMGALENPVFKPGCPNVIGKLGVQFGIHVLVSGSAKDSIAWDLVTRVTHPEITNPATGVSTTVDEWPSPMNIGIPRLAGWSFDEPWELKAGKWKIEILHQGKVLGGKEFLVREVGP